MVTEIGAENALLYWGLVSSDKTFETLEKTEIATVQIKTYDARNATESSVIMQNR